MPRKKRVEYKDYQDYLNSPAWEQIKKDYADNEKSIDCLICCTPFDAYDDMIKAHHHFRYPTDWNDDTWQNLICVCQKCHDFLHENITHDSEPITVRDYLSYAVSIYYEYKKSDQLDCEYFLLAQDFIGFEVVLDTSGNPYKILIGDKIIKNRSLAKMVVLHQESRTKSERGN